MESEKNKSNKTQFGFSIHWEGLYFNVEGDKKIRKAFFSKEPFFSYKTSALTEKIEKYFKGEKVNFKLKFDLELPRFTKKVLEKVLEIPYGKTRNYGEIAEELQTSPRAIGQALAKNPIVVLIPCHRVISKSGIGGYSYGVRIKKALLRLEGVDIF
ncbi:MAG: methylated-DNA--[protein]-cysteine S-methyltransferase [Archaeoglobaceae archaeon]|nr:methylated-DNA--[protein]-cysteine S-methyltransferase [Archaeoglobaceae archaeon]MDW7989438.1 methylated-DNA--[protein]-cysteine S-methyltransferase [Archaeoglobaceae archaeon]